ncbi:MAG: beta-ketoacyl-[acyl-carrier-protein] synthase family protein [Proteobacteria bacterium]|nr:beta-ketoacyl-[acyl-carrier-protein] synthase family protein [Pseudomonadota bacterium]
MSKRRVVITGMGAVSPFGVGVGPLWQGLREGRSAIAPLRHPESARVRMKVAAQLPEGIDLAAMMDESMLPLLDRCSQFVVAASNEAVRQCGLDMRGEGERIGTIIGTGIGGVTSHDEQSKRLYGEGAERMHPLTIVRTMANAPASHVSMVHGLRGPVFSVSSACASANHAVAQALATIRSGAADVMLTGGTEACLTFGLLKAWDAMRVVADDTCRPFSANRRGLVLGEGAAVFVLEEMEHAKSRGATILVELAGAGMSADAGDIVAPSAEGAALSITRALQDAELEAADIGYINAHGTGTMANDATESRAIRIALGTHAQGIPVTSTKSMHGHALGAAGALELVAMVSALDAQFVPPTANYEQADPACDLDIVPNVGRPARIRAALSNSFAFGGLNAVLAVRQA